MLIQPSSNDNSGIGECLVIGHAMLPLCDCALVEEPGQNEGKYIHKYRDFYLSEEKEEKSLIPAFSVALGLTTKTADEADGIGRRRKIRSFIGGPYLEEQL